MPIATPEVYNEMLDTAKKNGFAFPAINCTSSETINAALKGFAEAESDGIIQFSTGGAEFGSGLSVKNKVAAPFKEVELALVYGKGFDQLSDLVGLAADMDIIKKAGSFYSYGDERIGQGHEPQPRESALKVFLIYIFNNARVMMKGPRKLRAN